MDASEYIRELLYDHDCVIIPGFGGFIGSYTPAIIHPHTFVFSPPSKKIVFNRHLNQDDGLLIHSIASREHIPYEEAKEQLLALTSGWEDSLMDGEQVGFQGIGFFRLDNGSNLRFQQDDKSNLLASSFGLEVFSFPPADRRQRQIKTKTVFAERSKKSQRRKAVYATLSLAVPLLMLLLWFLSAYNPGFMIRQEKAALVPEVGIAEKQEVVASGSSSETHDTDTGESAANAEENGQIGMNPELPPEPPPGLQEHTAESFTFFIIGGAFREEENAKKLMEELGDKGFDPVVAGQTPSGLIMVAVAAHHTKNDAVVALKMIRNEISTDVWLYVKK